jgi:heme exporter protein A
MLTLSRVQVHRDDKPLFQPLSLSLAAGQGVHLLAPNGYGKSTLLKALVGLYPHQGQIHLRHPYHFITHQNPLLNHLTVIQQLHYWAALFKISLPPTWPTTLQKARLLPNAPLHQLSQGQQRTLNLLRLMLIPRPLWLLDEPLASLDAYATTLFQEALIAHLKHQGACLLVSHQPLEAPYLHVQHLS